MKPIAIHKTPPTHVVRTNHKYADWLKTLAQYMLENDIPCIEYGMDEGENCKCKADSLRKAVRNNNIPLIVTQNNGHIFITRKAN